MWLLSERVKTKLLRAKVNMLHEQGHLEVIFAAKPVSRAEWDAKFALKNLAHAIGLLQDDATPDHIASARSHLSHKLTGDRPCTIKELKKLAEYLHLDTFLGLEDAVRCLMDEVNVDELATRLRAVSWATPERHRLDDAPTRERLLGLLDEFSISQTGLLLGPELVMSAAEPGPERGLRHVRKSEPPANLPPVYVEDRVRVTVNLHAPCGILLLLVNPEESESTPPRVTCLAPALSTPAQLFEPGRVLLPLLPVNGATCYVVDRPVGASDLIAILTPNPPQVDWSLDTEDFHHMSGRDIGDLLEKLRATKKAGQPIEVRRYSFRVIERQNHGRASNPG